VKGDRRDLKPVLQDYNSISSYITAVPYHTRVQAMHYITSLHET